MGYLINHIGHLQRIEEMLEQRGRIKKEHAEMLECLKKAKATFERLQLFRYSVNFCPDECTGCDKPPRCEEGTLINGIVEIENLITKVEGK